MSVLYKFQKDRIKDSIIKRVKVKKRRKYGLFPISRQVRKCEKFNSIPVRVTILSAWNRYHARKARKYALFLCSGAEKIKVKTVDIFWGFWHYGVIWTLNNWILSNIPASLEQISHSACRFLKKKVSQSFKDCFV